MRIQSITRFYITVLLAEAPQRDSLSALRNSDHEVRTHDHVMQRGVGSCRRRHTLARRNRQKR